ncbi:acetyltransferase [Bradyrhizobium guangdongense]
MNQPVIIIGAGGHGSVIADALLESGIQVLGFTDRDSRRCVDSSLGLGILGADEQVLAGHSPGSVVVANGVGGVGSNEQRRQVQMRIEQLGWRFATVRHPSAIVSRGATISGGAQLLAGSVIQIGAVVHAGVIVNTRAVIEHHCDIGCFAHIAPGAVVCGEVEIGWGSHIGAGAVVKQGVRLGPNTLVGAGAVVVRHFEGNGTLLGAPARRVESRS